MVPLAEPAAPPAGGRRGEAPSPPDALAHEEVERALLAAEEMRRHLGVLDEQRALLAANAEELRRAIRTLEAVGAAASGDVLLMPLGGGTYVRATLAAPGKVLANVGAGVHVESGVDDAVKVLAERAQATEAAIQRVGEEAARVEKELNALARALQGA